jgi:phosphoesterase RecJ-like protein
LPYAPSSESPLHNTPPEAIARRLLASKRVLILTHTKPDGDAAGSTLALARALRHARPNIPTEVWYFGPSPAWLRDVAGPTPFRTFEPPTLAPDARDFSTILISDTCSPTQLEPMRAALAGRAADTLVIDHHVQGDAAISTARCVDVSAAAVCQPVARVCMELLAVREASALPADVAEALYLGLATDTGWFRHSNVSRRVMALAGELLDAGANHVRLYQLVEQRETLGRLRLISRALASVDLRLADRLALLSLSLDDLRACGALPGETGGLTDFTQAMQGVVVSALITEVPPEQKNGDHAPMVKISLRSKSEPVAVDVNRVASSIGGGGHIRAAGAKLRGSIDDAKAMIERLIAEQLGA